MARFWEGRDGNYYIETKDNKITPVKIERGDIKTLRNNLENITQGYKVDVKISGHMLYNSGKNDVKIAGDVLGYHEAVDLINKIDNHARDVAISTQLRKDGLDEMSR